MALIYIYELVDPTTKQTRYIGKTNQQLKDRLRDHIKKTQKAKKPTHKEAWIKGLLSKGLTPEIRLVEVCNVCNWAEREKYWIELGRNIGLNLTNLSIGGDAGTAGVSLSEERKQQVSNQMKGNKYGLGKKWTPQQREKMMKQRTNPWNKGKTGLQKHDDEWRAKASQRMTGDNHVMAKLTNKEVEIIRQRFAKGETAKDLANEYGITYSHMVRITTFKIRKNG